MTSVHPTSKSSTVSRPSPVRKSQTFRTPLAIVLLLLIVPLALKGLAGYSPVVDVRNRVDALGGRVNTVAAVPEFLQSIAGKDWDGWKDFYGGVEVDQITLSQSAVRDEHLVLLQATSHLKKLQLQGTKITDAGVSHLVHVPLLIKLDLGNTALTDAGMDHLQSLENLQSLTIAGTSVSDVGLAKLTGLKNLTELNASGTQVTDASLTALSEISSLQTLVLAHCDLTDAGLASLKACKSLTYLSLEGIPLTGSFMKELSAVPLEYLNLADSKCDGTALTDFGNLQSPRMLNLNLNNCPVEDAGIASIAAIPGLETLSLDNTRISEFGIAGLKDMPWLRTLSVNSTPVSAAALRELRDTPRLQLIKANKTKVSRRDIDTLAAEIKSFAVTTASTGGD